MMSLQRKIGKGHEMSEIKKNHSASNMYNIKIISKNYE